MKVQSTIEDPRPKVELPGAGRLVSDFAKDLACHLRDKNVFARNGETVTLRADNSIQAISPEHLRTLVERHVVCYRVLGKENVRFNVTMRSDDSRAVLASTQFQEGLRSLSAVHSCRMPVMRKGKLVELLPAGYDEETKILTASGVEYPEDLDLDEAKKVIDDLLAEFCFADGGRSKAVVVAAMVGLFAGGLLPPRSLRPAFIFLANAEGAGKTLLAKCVIVPVLGHMPVGTKADEDCEMQKALLTAVREARAVIFFDNVRGRLVSAHLEAFLSATEWTGRLLGLNQSFSAENRSTTFVTGNGLSVTPDLRRRSLFVELHLEIERAEDRVFGRTIDDTFLTERRPEILGALWAIVQHWDDEGRPRPSRGHSAFPAWADIIGGIVEAAGFGCAFETPQIEAAGDVDGQDMRSLVMAMGEDLISERTFSQLTDLVVERGLFERFVDGDGLNQKTRAAFSAMLKRYDRRTFGREKLLRFRVQGKGHNRRFKVEAVQ